MELEIVVVVVSCVVALIFGVLEWRRSSGHDDKLERARDTQHEMELRLLSIAKDLQQMERELNEIHRRLDIAMQQQRPIQIVASGGGDDEDED